MKSRKYIVELEVNIDSFSNEALKEAKSRIEKDPPYLSIASTAGFQIKSDKVISIRSK